MLNSTDRRKQQLTTKRTGSVIGMVVKVVVVIMVMAVVMGLFLLRW